MAGYLCVGICVCVYGGYQSHLILPLVECERNYVGVDLTTMTQNGLPDGLVLIVHSLQSEAIPADMPKTETYGHAPKRALPV